MRWFETPNFDFVSKRKIAYVISGILLAISIGAILTKGLQYGIDFKGGKEIVLKFESAVDVTEIRSSLTTPLGSTPEVKLFGSESEVLIRTDNTNTIEEIETIVRSTMSQLYPDNDAITEKTDSVGPRIAEDLIIWNSEVFNLINLSDKIVTGSSIMPQKKNPDLLEYLRGKSGTTYGNLFSMLTILKGLPLSYFKDLQDDKEIVFKSKVPGL